MMRCAALRCLLAVWLAAGALLGAESAHADSFKLVDPIDFDDVGGSGVFGTVNVVDDTTGLLGPSGGNIGLGPPDFTGVDILIFDVTLDPGSNSVFELAVSVPAATTIFVDPLGAGSYQDAGDQAPSAVAPSILSGEAIYTFADPLEAGETSVRLFISYTAGNLLEGQFANFQFSSGANFMVNGPIIPEPSTALLVGLGLAGLGFASTRKAR